MKTVSGVFISLILYLILIKESKDTAFVLSLLSCCMILVTALTYFKPVLNFFDELSVLGNLDSDIIFVVLKTVGIGILGEVTCSVCTDAGNAALGKSVLMLSSVLILWLTIPIFRNLLDLIQDVLLSV